MAREAGTAGTVGTGILIVLLTDSAFTLRCILATFSPGEFSGELPLPSVSFLLCWKHSRMSNSFRLLL